MMFAISIHFRMISQRKKTSIVVKKRDLCSPHSLILVAADPSTARMEAQSPQWSALLACRRL